MSAVTTITKYLPGSPPGNPAEIEAAAVVWRTVAEGLRVVVDDTQREVSSLGASWHGPGRAAFDEEWTRLAEATREACARLDDLAGSLSRSSSQLLNAQRKYLEIQGAAAVTFVVGLATSELTFGASDIVAGMRAAAQVAEAVDEAEQVISLAGAVLWKAAEIAVQIVIRFAVFSGIDLVAQGAISALVFPNHDPFGHLDFEQAAGAGLDQASPVWEIRRPALRILAQGFSDGAFNAASQAVSTGQVDPTWVAGSALFGAGGVAWHLRRLGQAAVAPPIPDPAPPPAG